MFTNLDQEQIKESIKWLLHVSESRTRVSKHMPFEVGWGSGYAEENQVTMTFRDIINVVLLDLKFAFTRTGKDIFRQSQGCPIGGCLSAIYAKVVMMKLCFLPSIYSLLREFLLFVRWMIWLCGSPMTVRLNLV